MGPPRRRCRHDFIRPSQLRRDRLNKSVVPSPTRNGVGQVFSHKLQRDSFVVKTPLKSKAAFLRFLLPIFLPSSLKTRVSWKCTGPEVYWSSRLTPVIQQFFPALLKMVSEVGIWPYEKYGWQHFFFFFCWHTTKIVLWLVSTETPQDSVDVKPPKNKPETCWQAFLGVSLSSLSWKRLHWAQRSHHYTQWQVNKRRHR